ncbi:hypothetical protein [Candidatus Enterococcus murrayae]|uniref:Uncharacterized protein n=1 Tax=Candidatus Enterococcus murrayae TaxID=2815321 RepID=A0ABS3HCG9_9ENTE|nr:hypothetical protein [Enterococcus sp. MJM16]MBO0451126.1 hypothetical protein [Enterococcus sp. MJM16]
MLKIKLTTHFPHFTDNDIVPFSDKGHPLHHLSKDSLANLLNDYFYNNLKNNKIIKKYGITLNQVNHLYQILPKVYTKLRCPYDNCKYQLELPSKTQFPFTKSPLSCKNCGHYDQDYITNPPKCNCHYCERIRQSEKNQQEDLNLNPLEKIELFLKNEKEKSPISFQSLSMTDRIDIATILQQSNIQFGDPIPYFGQYSTSPTTIHHNTLRILHDHGIIKIHGVPPEDIFQIKEEKVDFDPKAVEFDLNVYDELIQDNRILFDKLKFAKEFQITDEVQFRDIWRSYSMNIIYKIVDFRINKENIPVSKVSKQAEKQLYNSLYSCLEDYSLAQVYEIIWPAFRQTGLDAIEFLSNPELTYHEKNNYKIHLFDKLVEMIEVKIEFRRIEKYPIKGFRLNPSIPIPKCASVFFLDILNNENWFYTKIPSIREIENTNKWTQKSFYKSIRYHESFLSQYEIEELAKIIESASIIPFGLIAQIDHEIKLFATERDLFYLMENLEMEQKLDFDYYHPDWNTVSDHTSWKFGQPYTSTTIYTLIKELLKTNKLREDTKNE